MAITYNVLNLQQSLSQNGTTVASYTWLADGTKCGVVDNNNNGYDYTGSLIYSRSGSVRTLESAAFGGGRFVNTNNTILPYYYITDHLGSTRVITDNSGSMVERDDYYPFGGQLAISTYPQLSVNRFKFNGKELQTTGNTGFLDYGARMYDDVIGRWGVVDPLAEKRQGLSPYNFVQNNPLAKIDPNGMLDAWIYNKETEEYVWDGNVTKPSETPSGYEYVGSSLKDVDNHFEDNNPIASFFTNPTFGADRTPWPGEISPTDNLKSFEMWLGSPSESVGEGIGKIALNIGYSIVNSPYSLFTGQSIGGTSLNQGEKMDAFIDFVPGLITGGLTKTAQVVKTTQKGLQGYNQFVKGAQKSGIEFKGLNWQKSAGSAFQTNKVNQQALKDLDKARNVLNIGNTTSKELKK